MSTKSSSVYDHVLATWAMELSYTAYNYPNGDELFDIPGAFMGDVVKPADVFLREHGFTAEDFNYGHDESAAHVIAHRNITVSGSDDSQGNIEERTPKNGYNGYNSANPQANGTNNQGVMYDSVCNITSDTGRSVFTDTSDIGAFQSEVAETTYGSPEQGDTSGERQLVVVDIRGSVTALDFIMDVLTQFHVKFLDRCTGMIIVPNVPAIKMIAAV